MINYESLISDMGSDVKFNWGSSYFYDVKNPNKKYFIEIIEFISKKCHEVNKIYCSYLGDNSQVGWDYLTDDIKSSIMNGVLKVIFSKNFNPEESHKNWLNFKIKDGWVYGPKKNLVLKTHPNIVDYNDLPDSEKKKDLLFVNNVNHYLKTFKLMGILKD